MKKILFYSPVIFMLNLTKSKITVYIPTKSTFQRYVHHDMRTCSTNEAITSSHIQNKSTQPKKFSIIPESDIITGTLIIFQHSLNFHDKFCASICINPQNTTINIYYIECLSKGTSQFEICKYLTCKLYLYLLKVNKLANINKVCRHVLRHCII